MKKLLYYLTYYPIYWWMFLHALLPFRALYILSDILYFFVYKVVGYRLKVVRRNLITSFPDKTPTELKTLERKFYHHFCDYFVETIKLLHISDDTMRKHMQFENIELVNDLMKDGNSCFMFLGHYGNWEWVTSINLNFKNGELLGQVYKPLRNKAIDDLFLKLRSRFKSIGIPKNGTLRTIVNLRREQKQILIGFISDQTPSINNIHYWTQFLNHETPFFIGVERIAKQTGFAVTYLDIKKIKRGYYKGTVSLISDNPNDEPEFAITERYARAMEKTILNDPSLWLWTHKRWKYTQESLKMEKEGNQNYKKYYD